MGDETDQVSGSIGAVMSVDCGEEGYYQGRLAGFCPVKKTITLVCPIKDGRPVGKEVILGADQIKKLKVLRAAAGETVKPPGQAPAAATPPLQPARKAQQTPPQPAQQSTPKLPAPSTPQAVVAPLTHRPIELSELEAAYLKPAMKTDKKQRAATAGGGDQSDTSYSQTTKRQTRFEDTKDKGHQKGAEPQQQQQLPPAGGAGRGGGGGGGSSQRRRRRRNSENPTCSSARSTPTCASDEDEMLGIAPTPMFRMYEPQVANPTRLEPERGSMRYSHKVRESSRRNAGPSGIPSLDAARGRVTGRASDLSRPLDMDLLETDFDFESNLKLFNKETDVDEDFYETVEKPKMSVNYAHYENIVDDPERCTSWTNMHSAKAARAAAAYSEYDESEGAAAGMQRRRPGSGGEKGPTKKSPPTRPSTSERRRSTMDRRIVVSQWAQCDDDDAAGGGLRLPVLDEKEKARLAKETRLFLGEDAYSLLLADRVLEWMFTVIASQGIIVERVALLAADATSQSLLDRILMQLSARGCRVSLYGALLEKALPLVELVASERDLPSDVQMIVDLDPSMQRKSRSAELTRWLDALSDAHVICLDHVCPGVTDYDRVHALMVGALSTAVMDTMKKASMVVPKVGPTSVAELFGTMSVASKQSRPHIGLADLGVPFSWFGEEASSALSALFATTFVAPCNLK